MFILNNQTFPLKYSWERRRRRGRMPVEDYEGFFEDDQMAPTTSHGRQPWMQCVDSSNHLRKQYTWKLSAFGVRSFGSGIRHFVKFCAKDVPFWYRSLLLKQKTVSKTRSVFSADFIPPLRRLHLIKVVTSRLIILFKGKATWSQQSSI